MMPTPMNRIATPTAASPAPTHNAILRRARRMIIYTTASTKNTGGAARGSASRPTRDGFAPKHQSDITTKTRDANVSVASPRMPSTVRITEKVTSARWVLRPDDIGLGCLRIRNHRRPRRGSPSGCATINPWGRRSCCRPMTRSGNSSSGPAGTSARGPSERSSTWTASSPRALADSSLAQTELSVSSAPTTSMPSSRSMPRRAATTPAAWRHDTTPSHHTARPHPSRGAHSVRSLRTENS